jgi:hypothetical protein
MRGHCFAVLFVVEIDCTNDVVFLLLVVVMVADSADDDYVAGVALEDGVASAVLACRCSCCYCFCGC